MDLFNICLSKNNETILIGDMSSKSITKKAGNLSKMKKRVALSLCFFKFHERLKYKCSSEGVNYGKINEYCTSKMCSVCGYIKEDLGSAYVYNCNLCKSVMDKDVNGARNIHIKGIKK